MAISPTVACQVLLGCAGPCGIVEAEPILIVALTPVFDIVPTWKVGVPLPCLEPVLYCTTNFPAVDLSKSILGAVTEESEETTTGVPNTIEPAECVPTTALRFESVLFLQTQTKTPLVLSSNAILIG